MNKVVITILSLLLLLGFLTSILKISEVPPGMSHDELEYVNNGYSIFKTGKDLYGDFLPVSIGGVGYVALPAYFSGVFTSLFGLSELSARFPAILFGTLEIFFIYLIAKKIFNSERIGLASAFVLTLSTWGLKISRVMHDSSVSLFFFLLGILLFLYFKNLKMFALSLVAICLGVLGYYGSLFVFPFVLLILFYYRWDFIKTRKINYLLTGFGVLGVFGIILGVMLFTPGQSSRSSGRSGELIIFQEDKIADNVIFERSQSIGPEIFDQLFINKGTYIWKDFFFNYLEAFSPRMIFIEGDPNVNYGLWGRGELSVLDFPLILMGLFYLYSKSKKGLLFLGLIILISPITSGLTGTVYATRAFLMWPFLMILAGGGLAFIYEWAISGKNEMKWKLCLLALFLLVYTFFFAAKVYQYFYRYPVYAKEAWFHSEKLLSEYLMSKPDREFEVYSPESRQVFMEYFFYKKLDPKIAQMNLDKTNIKGAIQIGNVKFINGCIDPLKVKSENTVIIDTECVPLNIEMANEKILTQDGNNRIKWAIYYPENN